MKKTTHIPILSLIAAAAALLGPPSASAQERTVRISVQEVDPTAPKEGGWVVGFSGDYWSVSSDQDPVAPEGAKTRGQTGGFGAWAGKGDWFGNVQHRQGTIRTTAGALTVADKLKETELTGRYTLTDKEGGIYLLFGWIDQTRDYTLTAAPPFVFTANGRSTLQYQRRFSGPLVGYGASIPLGQSFAFIADLKLGVSKVKYEGLSSSVAAAQGNDKSATYYSGTLAGAYRVTESSWLRAGLKVYTLSEKFFSDEAIDKSVGFFVNYAFSFK